jgi:hypothetical protein
VELFILIFDYRITIRQYVNNIFKELSHYENNVKTPWAVGRVVVLELLVAGGWLHFAVRATGDGSYGVHFRGCKAAAAALKDRGRLKRCPEAAATRVD